MANAADNEIVLEVVRGQRPWTDLGSLGIIITFEGQRTRVQNPTGIVVVAGPADIAQGLLAYRGRPRELRTWARVILAGIPFLDLALEEEPVGDILLDALHNADYGEPISEEAFTVAERLVEQGGRG